MTIGCAWMNQHHTQQMEKKTGSDLRRSDERNNDESMIIILENTDIKINQNNKIGNKNIGFGFDNPIS